MLGLEYLLEPVLAADEKIAAKHRRVAESLEERTLLRGFSLGYGISLSLGLIGSIVGGVTTNVIQDEETIPEWVGIASAAFALPNIMYSAYSPFKYGTGLEGSDSRIVNVGKQVMYNAFRALRISTLSTGIAATVWNSYELLANQSTDSLPFIGMGLATALSSSIVYLHDNNTDPPARDKWKNAFSKLKSLGSNILRSPKPATESSYSHDDTYLKSPLSPFIHES